MEAKFAGAVYFKQLQSLGKFTTSNSGELKLVKTNKIYIQKSKILCIDTHTTGQYTAGNICI
jgi:hypothetical protein